MSSSSLTAAVVAAVIGAVVTAVLTLTWRAVWRRVLLPVGDAARALTHLADVVNDARLIPGMDEYLHQRMHDLLAGIAALRAGQDTFPHQLELLAELTRALRETADELAGVADQLRPPA